VELLGFSIAIPLALWTQKTLVAMAAIQHHRGPDGFGYKTVPDLGIGFSHAVFPSSTWMKIGQGSPLFLRMGNLWLPTTESFMTTNAFGPTLPPVAIASAPRVIQN
jgi:hypothetical protein